MRWHFRLLGVTAILVIGASWCIAAVADSGSSEYVDARVCAKCHGQIADDYAKTGMGRSFFRATAANIPQAGTDFYHALSDTHYSTIQRGGQYFQRRWQIGFAGKETNVEELRIDYVMGSGNHSRSYLNRTPRGTLIELPLGWYSEDGGHLGMSPGSDSDHPRTRRFVSYKCMFCHNAVPQIPAANEAPGSDPVFTGDLPEGIDCQRCHGPGGRHIRTVGKRGSGPADIRASIVNPARLSSKLRLEVCMQCHLETSSERIPAVIVRFNRGPFAFVPGQPLDAFMLSFDHAPGTGHDGKFEAVSSAYRLRQSKCFLKSAGNLTCETCHNPHRVARGEEAVTKYSTACRQCHSVRQGSLGSIDALIASGKHTNSADCVTCHMPKRRAEDTPGMVMTDHLIQRRPPARDLLAKFGERPPEEYHGEVVPYYPAPLPATPANALYRAVAQVAMGNNPVEGLPALAREIARQKPADAQFYTVLGDGWQSAGKVQDALAAYEQAVRLNPKSVTALRSLAAGWNAAGEMPRAADILNRAIQLAPDDPITWHRFGMLDFAAGRIPEALQKVRKAVELDPTLPDQSRSLGEILMKAGQMDEARTALREALRTDPYDASAWDLEARVLTERGQTPEAAYSFERAIRLQPGNATHRYDYGLALARMDRFDEALQQAQSALRIDPNMPEGHELLGAIFEKQHRLPEAVLEYRRVLELHPELARIRLRLEALQKPGVH